ncbi:hypothetical protein C8Q80DRAFT_1141147 [Daedaleopsis nitida]|nr:hypothetical protein C8Q80DRAFT_1141147 [Daedaleopsis nitida]
MISIEDLPVEVLEQILLMLDPLDVAQFAQTRSDYYAIVYTQEDQHLWRELYLQQPFDDPRRCLDSLGRPFKAIDWKSQLQRIMRARTILARVSACRPEERCTILHTLLDMVITIPPVTQFEAMDPSLNHGWVTAMLRGSTLLEHDEWELSDDERQLRARLHTHYGLTPRDFEPHARTLSRAYVYAMRHYKYDNDFGPFTMDGSGRVNWVHVRAIHHVMSLHVVPPDVSTQMTPMAYTIFPMCMPWTMSVIPEAVKLDDARDWAGVTGRWQCSFCFCDHRELMLFNGASTSETEPLNTELFDDPDFIEVFRSIYVDLRVLGTEEDPDHLGRPRIDFGGSIDGNATIVGFVKVTPDGHIRWHFTSGEHGNAIWSSEGVQVGNVRSKFGVLGSWTTVLHERFDPVGPFWLWKIEDIQDVPPV